MDVTMSQNDLFIIKERYNRLYKNSNNVQVHTRVLESNTDLILMDYGERGAVMLPSDVADFLAHSSGDVGTLIMEVERLQRELDKLQNKQANELFMKKLTEPDENDVSKFKLRDNPPDIHGDVYVGEAKEKMDKALADFQVNNADHIRFLSRGGRGYPEWSEE